MKVRVFFVVWCALLAGCNFEMPTFDSGRLEVHTLVDGYDRTTTSPLSQDQLSAISAWFSTHRTGWSKSYVDAAPARFVHLAKAGAPIAYFNLSGDTLYAASYSRVLTPTERQALESILEAKS